MPIIISDTGKLLDGQHRLKAVLMSQKPLKTYVRWGVPEASFVHIDNGAARTAADFILCKNKNIVAAAAKYLLKILNYDNLKDGLNNVKYSRSEVVEFANDHLEELEACSSAVKGLLSKRGYGFASTSAAAIWCIAQVSSLEEACAFGYSLSQMPKNNFVFDLQNFFKDIDSPKGAYKRLHQAYYSFILILAAWQYDKTGTPSTMRGINNWIPCLDGFEYLSKTRMK